MSAIAGIFHRDGRMVSPKQIQLIQQALSHRGPDGISSMTMQNTAFIHCMFHDTPESLLEQLPAKSLNGQLHITWSGRLDNREELHHQTEYKKPLSQTTDSDLVLAAYEKWNTDCVGHLLGDFAFAIWAPQEQKLFCARDHMGVKPFYYFLNHSTFAFSSEIKGIRAGKIPDGGINEDRIADYLTYVVTDTESTFYRNIFRLPPGHFLIIGKASKHLSCYWKPHPQELPRLRSRDYEERFSEIFKEATRCRLRSAFPVGSFLSGGIDSSSIVCMAAGPLRNAYSGQLHTYSGIFNTIKRCDEREFFTRIIKRYNTISSHVTLADTIDPKIAYDSMIASAGEPFWAPHFFMPWHLMEQAGDQGVRILLDGHDGDSVVSHGLGLFPELLSQGKYLRLLKECRATANNASSFRKTLRLVLKIVAARAVYTFSQISPAFMKLRHIESQLDVLSPDFRRKNEISDRLLSRMPLDTHLGMTESLRHPLSLCHPFQSDALEFFDNQSIQRKIICRYPFFDKRLIEFCIALPSEQKRANGYNRSIMRRSLQEIIPSAITLRKSKTDFMPNLIHSFTVTNPDWIQFNIDRISDHAYNYINRRKLLQTVSSFHNAPHQSSLNDLGFILRSISLTSWLDNQ
jgi:asparagine synthase (glutamine-hydrolysing)